MTAAPSGSNGVTFGLEHDDRELADRGGYERATTAYLSAHADDDTLCLSSNVRFGPIDGPTIEASTLVMYVDDEPQIRVADLGPTGAWTISWDVDSHIHLERPLHADLERRVSETDSAYGWRDRREYKRARAEHRDETS